MDQTRTNNRVNYQQQNDYQPAATNNNPVPKGLMLARGFSRVQANQEILNETRAQIENNLGNKNSHDSNEHKKDQKQNSSSSLSKKLLNNELTCYSFMLPNLNQFSDYKLKEYLQNELIELPAQYNLTESGHLNWWTQNNWENVFRPLYPMVTSGDGNCLLHAASLAMWGLHDRYLILRKALHSTLKDIKEDNTNALWRRWKWEQMCQNRKYGLIYDEDEWSKEWQSLLKLASYQPRVHLNNNSSTRNTNPLPLNTNDLVNSSSSSSVSSNVNKIQSNSNINGAQQQQQQQQQQDGTCYFESLEEFHVFLLAHILHRPIIIVSDTMLHDLNGEPLSPIPFGGIYLPFECELNKCHRYPLVLAYDSAHFSALVLMDDDEDNETENGDENGADDDEDEDYDINEDDINNQIDTDENHDLASFYPNRSKENILTSEQINQINKKLQLRPPYSMIPLTYSNKELLPLHFAHDPGPNYDWSKFPLQQDLEPKRNQLTSSTNSSSHSLNDEVSVTSVNKRNGANSSDKAEFPVPELSRNEKMFLIQKYLDIVKLELYDPGPLGKRNANNQAFNSSGMCATICNVNVSEPVELVHKLENGFSLNGKNKQNSKSQNKFQKFINLFKRNNQNETTSTYKIKSKPDLDSNHQSSSSLFNGGKFRKSIKNISDFASSRKTPELTSSTSAVISTNPNIQSMNRIDLPALGNNSSKTLPSKLKSPSVISSAPFMPIHNAVSVKTAKNLHFHKLVTYKNWSVLFDSMTHHSCLLGVKLNLAKLPKFKKIIYNYIESTKHKLDLIKQQKAQILQQQQLQQHMIMQQRVTNNGIINNRVDRRSIHTCPASRHDCNRENLCNYCYNNIHSNENLNQKNINITRQNNNYNQFSYNNNSKSNFYYKNNEKIHEDEITAYHHI